jgi:hypothetical protein
MQVVPDEVGTCKPRCVLNFVRTNVVAGKGWHLWFGACGDCCLRVVETLAMLIVALFVGMGAQETY